MKTLLVWGTGNTAKMMMRYISKDIKILGFVDNAIKPGKSFYGYEVYTPEEMMHLSYDYLIVCSIFAEDILKQTSQMNLESTKIIVWNNELWEKYFVYKNFFFRERIEEFDQKMLPVELLVTGISYANDGIAADRFKVPAFNFAYRSQDLFCDFEIVKYLFDNYNMSTLKYMIIGMSYYSFEYDLSKSNGAWQLLRYYPYIHTLHNLINSDYYEEYNIHMLKELENNQFSNEIFKADADTYELNFEEGKNLAKMDFNKNYPVTVFENKKILAHYLKYLEDRNIKPIIVIVPVTKYYAKHCPIGIKEKFYRNLDEILGSRDIQVLDYFDQLEYTDDFFYHVTHLNKRGAEKFTEKLNLDINW